MTLDSKDLQRVEALFAAGQVPEPAAAPSDIPPDAPPATLDALIRRRRAWLDRRG